MKGRVREVREGGVYDYEPKDKGGGARKGLTKTLRKRILSSGNKALIVFSNSSWCFKPKEN